MKKVITFLFLRKVITFSYINESDSKNRKKENKKSNLSLSSTNTATGYSNIDLLGFISVVLTEKKTKLSAHKNAEERLLY